MSHTKRYWIDDHSAIEDTDGKWVLHSDHAALVQQGIRDHQNWRSKLNFLEADYKAEIARLTAENERLLKAGEMLFECIEPDIDDIGYNYGFKHKHAEARDAWLAAKEGSDAK